MVLNTTFDPNNVNNPTKEIMVGKAGQYLGVDRPGTDTNTPQQLIDLSNGVTSTTTTPDPNQHSILPASGFYPSFQEAMSGGAFPELLSSAKWSDEDKGYPQQTFLGASIRSFNMTGGFGDNSSSLTVDLVVDEYNRSDRTPAGQGDDVYFSGANFVNGEWIGDKFVPPIPGSPVYFKFGPNFATVEEAFRKTFDDLYYYNTVGNPSPESTGSTTLKEVIEGKVNLTPNQYVNLYIQDYVDGGPIVTDTQSRTILDYSSIRNNSNSKGKDHLVFGGILQTYNQNRSSNGNPLYTVNVIDPREILSNVTVVLNNYSGPTFEQPNILNVYGFLEYNPTDDTKNSIKSSMPFENKLTKTVSITGNDMGSIKLAGDDKYYKTEMSKDAIDAIREQIQTLTDEIAAEKRTISTYRKNNELQGANASYDHMVSLSTALRAAKVRLREEKENSLPKFPITGTGYSRRSSQGIPFYRVQDAINALMGSYGPLPQEYADQGFGGRINFRGFNYVVDFGSLPDLPEYYFLDFDQINLLELAMEICDITNHDLFVTLLPVIDHPACATLYQWNNESGRNFKDLIAGIIRIDVIDRSEQPFYGAIKKYIDELKDKKIYIENQDLGYELSNITTDKFIVGAQEIDMYYFSSNGDRDTLAFKKTGKNGEFPGKPAGYQWTLEASLEQQILPYYGKLGNNAVTIPKGFGAYQQILLDASSLNAAGVGAYYVATEMELRCAMISFDRWKEFLKMYNEVYMDSIESDDISDMAIAGMTPTPKFNVPAAPVNISTNYAVSVPRSVFDTYALPKNGSLYGTDGLPLSACNPPYGYPLYYKRMTRIGIPEGGLTDLYTKWTSLTTNLAELQCANASTISALISSQFKNLDLVKQRQGLTAFEQQYYDILKNLLEQKASPQKIQESVGTLENVVKGNGRRVFAILPSVAKKNNENAIKVYNFVKSVAEECLGKKFLVKIPTEVNLFFNKELKKGNYDEYTEGPFGFKPRSTRNIAGYEFTAEFQQEIDDAKSNQPPSINMMQSFLSSGVEPNPTSFGGGLRVNYNPMSEKYESNYTPMNIGGYFPFDLYQNTLGVSAVKDIANANFNMLPLGVRQGFVPQDLTNFINEDGRIAPYVRIDNCEDLTLEGLNDADFTQQFVVGNYMIPDMIGALDNTGGDEFHSFPNMDEQDQNQNQNQTQPQPKQIAFIKCSVDEHLYLPPKLIKRQTSVHAQSVIDIGTVSLPQKIYIPCSGIEDGALVPGSGVFVDSFTYYKANYVPEARGGSSVDILDFKRKSIYELPGGELIHNTEYVDTDADNLNTEHAYALITLPNRVLPNKDSRHRDGMFQSMNAERFKHLMTMDVVRGLPGFDSPSTMGAPPGGNLKPQNIPGVKLDTKIHAWFAMKKAMTGLSFGMPYQVNFSMPSPVYPDLVALPLMSNDRCYGPWVSSQLDGQAYLIKNIGGRVDFIKDENLSPWNYGGYHLMNEAGRLQAEFSNSLLLFSERGSFTIAGLPSGNSLCKALLQGGPLVTSINLDVSINGAKTTYQMDLYTASFGKLQKQKQEEFSKMSRERKKLISERNALIRKGMGKNQSNRNFNTEMQSMRAGVMPGLNEMGLGMANALTRLTMSMNRQERDTFSSSLGGSTSLYGSTGTPSSLRATDFSSVGGVQPFDKDGKTASLFKDKDMLAASYYNSAGQDIVGERGIFTGYANGYHPNLPHRPNDTISAQKFLLDIDKDDINLDNGTINYKGQV